MVASLADGQDALREVLDVGMFMVQVLTSEGYVLIHVSQHVPTHGSRECMLIVCVGRRLLSSLFVTGTADK